MRKFKVFIISLSITISIYFLGHIIFKQVAKITFDSMLFWFFVFSVTPAMFYMYDKYNNRDFEETFEKGFEFGYRLGFFIFIIGFIIAPYFMFKYFLKKQDKGDSL